MVATAHATEKANENVLQKDRDRKVPESGERPRSLILRPVLTPNWLMQAFLDGRSI